MRSGEAGIGSEYGITSTGTGAMVRSASAVADEMATTSAGEVTAQETSRRSSRELPPELQLEAVERAHDRRAVTRLGGPAEQYVGNRASGRG